MFLLELQEQLVIFFGPRAEEVQSEHAEMLRKGAEHALGKSRTEAAGHDSALLNSFSKARQDWMFLHPKLRVETLNIAVANLAIQSLKGYAAGTLGIAEPETVEKVLQHYQNSGCPNIQCKGAVSPARAAEIAAVTDAYDPADTVAPPSVRRGVREGVKKSMEKGGLLYSEEAGTPSNDPTALRKVSSHLEYANSLSGRTDKLWQMAGALNKAPQEVRLPLLVSGILTSGQGAGSSTSGLRRFLAQVMLPLVEDFQMLRRELFASGKEAEEWYLKHYLERLWQLVVKARNHRKDKRKAKKQASRKIDYLTGAGILREKKEKKPGREGAREGARLGPAPGWHAVLANIRHKLRSIFESATPAAGDESTNLAEEYRLIRVHRNKILRHP